VSEDDDSKSMQNRKQLNLKIPRYFYGYLWLHPLVEVWNANESEAA